MSTNNASTITPADFPSPEAILSDSFLEKYRGRQPDWGFSGLGFVIFKRTYARIVDLVTRKLLTPVEIEQFKNSGKSTDTEEWNETVERCIRGAQKVGACYTKDEAEELYDMMFNLEAMFSGRALWQLNTPLVNDFGLADSLLNCWGTKIASIDDFCFLIIESLMGGGVGCNISKEYTFELPRIKPNVKIIHKNAKDADWIVPDSKEGWLETIRKVLESFFVTGKSFTFSTVCIRNQGELLKTFGGIAPGPQPLIICVENLCNILSARANKKLRTSDVADLININGQMVKSGGVRRTAIILGGDPDDVHYAKLKRWDLGNIPSWRSNSNNSNLCPSFDHINTLFWEGYNGNGEAYGLLNIPLARKIGRLGETSFEGFSLTDSGVIIFNPCAEATLADKECCNLASLAINRIKSLARMKRAAILLYKTQKAIAGMNYMFPETNKIVHKNMKLGMSVTGICQRLDVYAEWCDATYRELRKFDKTWSSLRGWPQSNRLSVIQPEGTKGLLNGSTPGGHPGFSNYHIRRVRFGAHEPIIAFLKEMGIPLEYEVQFDGTLNHDILVGEFPANFEEGTQCADDPNFGAIKQLELVKSLQTVWADQAVSVTVYYRPEELNDIKQWLKDNYDNCVKSISFLRYENHNFKQAPLENISKEEYHKRVKSIRSVAEVLNKHKVSTVNSDLLDAVSCPTGACPIR